MADFKSVFCNEISMYLTVRETELSHEAYRHNRRTIVLFDEYLCKINHTDKEIPEHVIESWIKEVSIDVSVNTASLHVHFIRQLLLFLSDLGYTCFIPRTLKTRDVYEPYLYSDEDIERIFAAADSLKVSRARKNKLAEKEIPMILRLLYCCGLRVGETVCIKVGDLDFERNLIVLRVTKKCKQRLVPFGKDLAEIIYRYCIGMGILNDSEAYLFPADDRYSHISVNCVGNYYRIIRKKAGINCSKHSEYGRGACLHCFRHSFFSKIL